MFKSEMESGKNLVQYCVFYLYYIKKIEINETNEN